MADINQESQQMAETLSKLRTALDESAGSIDRRRDQEMKAKHGIENFTAGTAKAANVLGALAGAGMAAASAMHKGEKGAAAFNSAVDGMADAAKFAGAALTLLVPGGPLIKGLVAGLTLATTALASYTKAANQMSDQLHKGYTGLAKSGAAASDGMTGLFKDAKKLGMSMNELDGYVQLIGANSRDLANFAGSVSDGRKQFANLGKEMEPVRGSLLNMGLTMEDQREGTMAYLSLQSRLGRAQSMTIDQLARGANSYLVEMDALTKLTGASRKEIEDQRKEAMIEEQFRAKLRQMELSGDKEGAERLRKYNDLMTAINPELGKGIRALSTGNLAAEEAQRLMLSSSGQAAIDLEKVMAGTMPMAAAADSTAKAIGEFSDAIGTNLALLKANNQSFMSYAAQQDIRIAQEKGFAETLAKIEADQINQGATGKKAADDLVQAQTNLVAAQVAANNATEQFVFKGVLPATKAMEALAIATAKAAGIADKLTPGGSKITQQDVGSAGETMGALGAGVAGGLKGAAMGSFLGPVGTAVGALIGSAAGVYLGGNAGKKIGELGAEAAGLPKAAEGGLLTGPKSGYMAMLHGTELVIPADMLKGSMMTGGSSAGGGNGPLADLHKEMLKDTEQLAKITDSDLKRARDFSRINIRLTELKTQNMEDEIELLEEQNQMLAEIEEIYTRTMGPEAARAAVKAFKRTQMLSNSAVPAGASGQAGGAYSTNTPSGPSAPSEVEGARVSGATAKASEVLDFTARSGSANAFEGLNSRLKDSVIAAAEEYHAATGRKIQVNSAKRDPSDQQRLWEESVALGTPGRGPSGMPIAKPGSSPHEHGLAIDIQNYNDPAAVLAMNRQGLKQKVPGDPVHFSFGDGGIANGPTSGYLAELHGPEAVVPLPDGKTIPVKIEGDMPGSNRSNEDMSALMNQFRSSMESMINQMNNRDLLNMMDEMVRAQKASNSIQEKLLRAAAS